MEQILITGVTGIVGSHVFYELMEEIVYEQRDSELHLLIRAKNKELALQRFLNEVWDERILPLRLKYIQPETVMDRIHIIPGGLTECDLSMNLGNDITVFHLAASVNLGNSKSSFADIYNNNYQATQIFFSKLKNRMKKVNFISTAFSSGDRHAVIRDNYHMGRDFNFRNPYEQYKHKMEAELLQRAANGEFECTIMRPSVVCGRLIKEPYYVMNRYIVFYMIGAFLTKMKSKYGSINNFRMVADPNGSLNIVPVDYAAKAIVRASSTKRSQVNITIRKNVANRLWIPVIIDRVGVENFEFVSEEPTDPSPIEKLYYKTVGPQINKYLRTSKHVFESQTVRELMADVDEPDVTTMFEELYNYAHSNNFQLAA